MAGQEEPPVRKKLLQWRKDSKEYTPCSGNKPWKGLRIGLTLPVTVENGLCPP